MQALRHKLLIAFLAAALIIGGSRVAAAATHEGFNDEYVYATTKSVSDMDMNPALKVTLIPATIILDTLFLPFAVVAGFVA